MMRVRSDNSVERQLFRSQLDRLNTRFWPGPVTRTVNLPLPAKQDHVGGKSSKTAQGTAGPTTPRFGQCADDRRQRHLSVLPGPPPGCRRYASGMNPDLRPCPFCSSSDLTIATATDDDITTVAVVCLECGATGPKGTGDDPPANIQHMWNQRYGADQ